MHFIFFPGSTEQIDSMTMVNEVKKVFDIQKSYDWNENTSRRLKGQKPQNMSEVSTLTIFRSLSKARYMYMHLTKHGFYIYILHK